VEGAPLTDAKTVRIWGRRRLLTLERLIAVASRVRVHLLGTGMPSFWVIEMDDITVTLGLSGWTANDWSAAGRFNLLQARHEVSDTCKQAVATALQKDWLASPGQIASSTGLPAADVHAALSLWVQAGRAVFDLPTQRFAWRELSAQPLPLESLRFSSPEEESALTLVHARGVRVKQISSDAGRTIIMGAVTDKGHTYEPRLVLNADQQLTDAQCGCNFYTQNKLRRGPCAHMLALRQLAQPQLNEARAGQPTEVSA
jgi:hypothetical protein